MSLSSCTVMKPFLSLSASSNMAAQPASPLLAVIVSENENAQEGLVGVCTMSSVTFHSDGDSIVSSVTFQSDGDSTVSSVTFQSDWNSSVSNWVCTFSVV